MDREKDSWGRGGGGCGQGYRERGEYMYQDEQWTSIVAPNFVNLWENNIGFGQSFASKTLLNFKEEKLIIKE